MEYIFIDSPVYPNRKDAIYKEIDNFMDHEISNCMAYELAIRNIEIREELKKYIKYYEMEYEEQIKDEYDFSKLLNYGFTYDAINYYMFKLKIPEHDKVKNYNHHELCSFFKRYQSAYDKEPLRYKDHQYRSLISLYDHSFQSGQYLEGLSCKYIERNKCKMPNIIFDIGH